MANLMMIGSNFVLSPIQSRQQTNQRIATYKTNDASSTVDLMLLLRMWLCNP